MHSRHSPVIGLVVAVLLLAACATPAGPETPPSTAVPTGAPAAEVSPVAEPAVAATNTPSSPATNVPLGDAVGGLEPQDVFRNFYHITQIPRPSGTMKQIRAFLVKFGQGLGLETTVDEAGNVLIRKPATAGMENRQGVVLQSHMDMVAQMADGKKFDPATEPIQAFVNGDYIVADGTTLGADDGIGIAMIMAILQSKTLATGPLEALFTADEESTMAGANGLSEDLLKGNILINVDSEEEGKFTIGGAGGELVQSTASYKQVPALSDMVSYQVKVKGLRGGHSGMDINLGRGHATKLLVRLLKGAMEPYQLRLASIAGGTVSNAIPRDASAVVLLPKQKVEAFSAYVQGYEATIQSELAAVEPDLSVELAAVEAPGQVMDGPFQTSIINALYGTPQGVIRMSDAVPGLVETSNNLGVTNVHDGQVELTCCARSSVDSEMEDASRMIASVWELAGLPAEFTVVFKGWNPNIQSPILGLMQQTYRDLYGKEAVVAAVHAGLECGAIGGKYPHMDMISIGPTMNNVHSLGERLFIPSVGRVMTLCAAVLQRIPEK